MEVLGEMRGPYLAMIRASALKEQVNETYSWMAPRHVIKLLDALDDSYAEIKSLRAENERLVSELIRAHGVMRNAAALLRKLRNPPIYQPEGTTCDHRPLRKRPPAHRARGD